MIDILLAIIAVLALTVVGFWGSLAASRDNEKRLEAKLRQARALISRLQ